MNRLKYYATMFAVIIGLLTTFNQTTFCQVEQNAQAGSAAVVASQISPVSFLTAPKLNPFVSVLDASFGARKMTDSLAFLAPVAAAPAAATIYTVNVTSDTGAGSGTTGDLRYAITQVNAGTGGDTINITATGTITLATALPVITKNVTITGPGALYLTISGRNEFRALQVGGGLGLCASASISNLTIAAGRADTGAGIGFTGCRLYDPVTNGEITTSLTVTNVAFSGNNASVAGGAIFGSGIVTVANCTFNGNSGGNSGGGGLNGGGAIYANNTLTVTNSTFSGNAAISPGASSGGAINATGYTVTIINSTFTDNRACGYAGGAILSNNIYTFVLKNSIFANNCGFYGPDISVYGTPPKVVS